MQPNSAITIARQINIGHLESIWRIARKELTLFFASPIAYLFLIAFSAITLFIFFWGESFFSRNIADVRPLFEWMPLLLIFLCSTLTMRMWSEERRTGTIEYLLTQPLPLWHFVVGKFAACLVLLSIALATTLALPITVGLLGDLDAGPVVSGYLATLLLGAVYLAIGLFVSAKTHNQIVSLICAAAICGVLYAIGTPFFTRFFDHSTAEFLRLLGSGARFEDITRGVIDFRDFYYYLSITAVFLTLGAYSLEKERWAATGDRSRHHAWHTATALLALNALLANVWLNPIVNLRVDTTEGKQYSLSDATANYLAQLQEPLLIRGYFSEKTHPLLAPLVPQMQDLLEEYNVASSNVTTEFIDPISQPELEQEAQQKYGIQPVPFQVADRHQASLVNSYFNVLVQYGNEYQVLGFRDLIDVKRESAGIDVQLRNPEYDITSAIKKAITSYQSGGNLFTTLKKPVVFTAYISEDNKLPEKLRQFKTDVQGVVDELKTSANGVLTSHFVDPEAGNGEVATTIANQYGFKPMTTNLFSDQRFYFYLTLQQDDKVIAIDLEDMSKDAFERNFNAALKRFSTGFSKTLGLLSPEATTMPNHFGMQRDSFSELKAFLGETFTVKNVQLDDGRVPADVDILTLIKPENLSDKQLFAVDQFLMQGGTVIAATSPYHATMSNSSLSVQEKASGLENWLAHHGIAIEKSLIKDANNTALPVPVTRSVGGFSFQEMRLLPYPYFIDVRGDQLNQENSLTAALEQVTFAWGSPISVTDNNSALSFTTLLSSSNDAWASQSTNVMPSINDNANEVPAGSAAKRYDLAVLAEGQFNSYFAGKENPLSKGAEGENSEDTQLQLQTVIEKSPSNSKLIVFASNDFLADNTVSMIANGGGNAYLGAWQLLANTLEWSLEDPGLLSIRARGQFNRTLPTLTASEKAFWEYLNYALAIFAVVAIGLIHWQLQRRKRKQYQLAFAANV